MIEDCRPTSQLYYLKIGTGIAVLVLFSCLYFILCHFSAYIKLFLQVGVNYFFFINNLYNIRRKSPLKSILAHVPQQLYPAPHKIQNRGYSFTIVPISRKIYLLYESCVCVCVCVIYLTLYFRYNQPFIDNILKG